jgi:hypothetical protein
MREQRPFGFGIVAALAAVLAVVGGVWRAQAQGSGASTVLRTLVYHEITAANTHVDTNGGAPPILSASGNRAAFGLLSYDPTRVAHIYLINADGTGQQEVDSYPFSNGVNALDISADGSKVISTYDANSEIRIASADGRGGRPLVTLKPDLGRIAAIRLSSDGSLVFFLLSGGNEPELADGTRLPRGLYVINADGSSPPRRIVGIPEIARLLGLPEEQYAGPLFGVDPGQPTLDVSSTAPPRIAFVTHIPPVGDGGSGEGVFAVNLDGSNLVSLTGRQAFASVAISGDGATVGYNIRTADYTADVVGVVGAGGTARELARSPAGKPAPFPTNGADGTPGFPSVLHDHLQLSYDGAWFLLGSTGVLVNTPTGYTLQLGVRGSGSIVEPGILYNGLYRATMNDSATRFLYMAEDAKRIRQLVTLDINPGSPGTAPSITNATVNPPFVLSNSRSTTSISAQVSASGTLYGVGYSILRNGLYDTPGNLGYGGLLFDNGSQGDARSGDSLFTNTSVGTDCCAVAGPRTVRVMAEVHAGDGRRHATAVEIAPFAVLDQSPAPGSTIEIPPSPTPTPPGTPGGTTTGGTTGGGTTGGTTTGGTTGGTTTGGGTQSIDLTGLWTDPAATSARYRIRQVGNQIYWSLDDLPHVANVFQGTLQGDIITGQWVDLPGGEFQTGMGTLVLHVESNDRLVKIGESSPYGIAPPAGTVWVRIK